MVGLPLQLPPECVGPAAFILPEDSEVSMHLRRVMSDDIDSGLNVPPGLVPTLLEWMGMRLLTTKQVSWATSGTGPPPLARPPGTQCKSLFWLRLSIQVVQARYSQSEFQISHYESLDCSTGVEYWNGTHVLEQPNLLQNASLSIRQILNYSLSYVTTVATCVQLLYSLLRHLSFHEVKFHLNIQP